LIAESAKKAEAGIIPPLCLSGLGLTANRNNPADVFLFQESEDNIYKRLARLIRNSLEWTSEKDIDIIKEAAAGT
jgi:hypothetical protein